MQRVLVLGCGGAGKTEFSKRLAQTLKLPHVHLDQHYWNPDWVASDDYTWQERLKPLLAESQWILDGNYGSTLELRLGRADTVIFLDYSTFVCLCGALQRIFTTHSRIRSDSPPGCPERLTLNFVRYIINYRRLHRRKVLEKLTNFKGTVVMLSSRRKAAHYLTTISPCI